MLTAPMFSGPTHSVPNPTLTGVPGYIALCQRWATSPDPNPRVGAVALEDAAGPALPL